MSASGRRPLRILEVRSVTGQGGGPEKSILNGARRADRARFRIELGYLVAGTAPALWVASRAEKLGLDYFEIRERHSLDPRIWTGLRRRVRATGVDLVHAHDHKTIPLALLLARAEGVVPLATVHGWTGRTLRERLLYYPLAKRLLRAFPAVVTVSEPLRRELVERGVAPERVRTLVNAIDGDEIAVGAEARARARAILGLAPEERVLGAVGRLARQKRFDLLLEAFGRIADRGSELRLLLIGEGEERTRLEALAGRLELRGRCRLLGHRADVAELLPAFDLFVQSSDYEGSSNALLEALAAEVPVVATDVGATAVLIPDEAHGRLVPARDVEALATAIAAVLEEPAASAARARAARARVLREFSFDFRQRRLEALYESLCEGRD